MLICNDNIKVMGNWPLLLCSSTITIVVAVTVVVVPSSSSSSSSNTGSSSSSTGSSSSSSSSNSSSSSSSSNTCSSSNSSSGVVVIAFNLNNRHKIHLALYKYRSPPLIRTPLLKQLSLITTQVFNGEREHFIHSLRIFCQRICILSRGVSSLDSVLLREGRLYLQCIRIPY